jgi:hypothetical protein
MVAMFWIWNPTQVGHFGSLFAVGVGLFAWNVLATIRRCPRRGAVAYGIASATVWLVVATLAGLFVVSSKVWPWISPFPTLGALHAHAHLGVLGGFVSFLVAVSFRLLPMFLLSELQSERRARAVHHLLNAGIAGLVPAMALDSAWKLVPALVVVAGLAVYAVEVSAIVARRRRPALDAGMRSFLGALLLLAPLSAAAVVLCWPGRSESTFSLRLENTYGFLAVFGVVGWAIQGMLYRILPFLVWYRVYGPDLGRGRVPALHELYSPGLRTFGLATYGAGLAGTVAAQLAGNETLATAAWALLLAGAAAFGANAARILGHWIRRRPMPVPAILADSPV